MYLTISIYSKNMVNEKRSWKRFRKDARKFEQSSYNNDNRRGFIKRIRLVVLLSVAVTFLGLVFLINSPLFESSFGTFSYSILIGSLFVVLLIFVISITWLARKGKKKYI